MKYNSTHSRRKCRLHIFFCCNAAQHSKIGYFFWGKNSFISVNIIAFLIVVVINDGA